MSQHAKQEVNWEFLLNSSKSTLQAYEQSRLAFAANLRKEIAQLLDVWVDESSNALLARWLIEQNLAADAAIRTNGASGSSPSSEVQELRPPVACCPQGAPKPPSRSTPHAGPVAGHASDKIFGDKAFATPRIHVAS